MCIFCISRFFYLEKTHIRLSATNRAQCGTKEVIPFDRRIFININNFPSIDDLADVLLLSFFQKFLTALPCHTAICTSLTACAFSVFKGLPIYISHGAAFAAAFYIAALFGCTYHNPAPKSMTRQVFCCHTGIPLKSAHSARPAGSGDTQGTHASCRTSPVQCEAGCPPALQKRSDCVRRP